jgi:hypothetical protein
MDEKASSTAQYRRAGISLPRLDTVRNQKVSKFAVPSASYLVLQRKAKSAADRRRNFFRCCNKYFRKAKRGQSPPRRGGRNQQNRKQSILFRGYLSFSFADRNDRRCRADGNDKASHAGPPMEWIDCRGDPSRRHLLSLPPVATGYARRRSAPIQQSRSFVSLGAVAFDYRECTVPFAQELIVHRSRRACETI